MEVEAFSVALIGIHRSMARDHRGLNITIHDATRETVAPTDDSLLASFLAGDDASFTALFERHNRRLFYYALKMVADAQAAEDLTQTLWEKVIDLRDTKDRSPIRNAGGFLFRVLRNLALDHKKHVRFQEKLDTVPDVATTHTELTDEEEIVLQSLEVLNDDSKEILVLHYYSGCSFEEIARMMDKKPNAIWTRASRARQELRTEMEKRFRRMERTNAQ